MIVRIAASNFDLGQELDKYTRSKIKSIMRFVPRVERATALVEVDFSEQNNAKSCQLQLKFRRETFTVKETTQHLYAALDIASAAVEEQLRLYKKHNQNRLLQHLRSHKTSN